MLLPEGKQHHEREFVPLEEPPVLFLLAVKETLVCDAAEIAAAVLVAVVVAIARPTS